MRVRVARSLLLAASSLLLLVPTSHTASAQTSMDLSGYEVTALPNYVTADGLGTHILSPNSTISYPGIDTSLDHTGVVELILTLTSGGAIRCSGSLLPGGTHILTAAHCVTDNSGVIDVNGGSANFNLAGGSSSVGISTVTAHPDWNGSLLGGNDIAIIALNGAAPVSAPVYDIYRGFNEVSTGSPTIKVGYGRSGFGDTGDTLASGTKRGGLNSYDLYSNFGANPTNSILMYDFDNGQSANDAIDWFGGPAHLGFGDDEVMAAPGDSGGPSFIEANDSQLTLSSENLGAVIVGANLTHDVEITKSGSNSTSYDLTIMGDSNTSSLTDRSFVAAGDVSDHKVAGVTSGTVAFGGQTQSQGGPDIDNTSFNASFGEFGIDTSVEYFQSFIDSVVSPAAPANATQFESVSVDTSSAGDKTVVMLLDNLATTSEFSGVGSSDINDVAGLTATVLDHSNASFDSILDQDSFVLDFGTVNLGQNGGSLADSFSIFNLESTVGFTADLLVTDATAVSGDTSVLSLIDPNLTIAAGDSGLAWANLDTTTFGSYSAVWDIEVSDENLLGSTTSSLQITLIADILSGFIAGDFDGSGQVEQGDLTLLLTYWGAVVADGQAPDSSWVNTADITAGAIDQDELTVLLSNWGNTASLNDDLVDEISATTGLSSMQITAMIPEPTTAIVFSLGLISLLSRRQG